MLIINIVSQDNVDLYNKYHSNGFEIFAFPSNQFDNQEPDNIDKVRKDMFIQFDNNG